MGKVVLVGVGLYLVSRAFPSGAPSSVLAPKPKPKPKPATGGGGLGPLLDTGLDELNGGLAALPGKIIDGLRNIFTRTTTAIEGASIDAQFRMHTGERADTSAELAASSPAWRYDLE